MSQLRRRLVAGLLLSVAALVAAGLRLATSWDAERLAAAAVAAVLAALFGASLHAARSQRQESAAPVGAAPPASAPSPGTALLGKLSHGLRTPLSAVIGYTELLREEVEEAHHESYLDDLDRIHASARTALQVVDDMFDLSLVESGEMRLRTREFDPAALLDQVCVSLEDPLERNRNRLEVKRDPSLGAMKTDRDKLRQILLSLLGNAARATHKGTVQVEAHRTAEPDGDWLRFVVRDDGKGLTPDQLEMLFEDLDADAPDAPRSLAGTDLGLPLTRRLCELLGGSIEVTSQPGAGTEFRVRLPAELEQAARPSRAGEHQ